MEVAGLGMEVGGGEGIEDARGGAAVEEAVGTGDVPAVAVGGTEFLALDEIVDGFVVRVDFGLRESRRGGGGQGGGGCREGGSLKSISTVHGYPFRTLARASFMMGP